MRPTRCAFRFLSITWDFIWNSQHYFALCIHHINTGTCKLHSLRLGQFLEVLVRLPRFNDSLLAGRDTFRRVFILHPIKSVKIKHTYTFRKGVENLLFTLCAQWVLLPPDFWPKWLNCILHKNLEKSSKNYSKKSEKQLNDFNEKKKTLEITVWQRYTEIYRSEKRVQEFVLAIKILENYFDFSRGFDRKSELFNQFTYLNQKIVFIESLQSWKKTFRLQ